MENARELLHIDSYTHDQDPANSTILDFSFVFDHVNISHHNHNLHSAEE
jgi:hypothetical protein